MNQFSTLAEPSRLWGIHQESVDVLRANPRRLAPDMVRIFLANRVPITTWGPPGARKTRTIEAFSEEADASGIPFMVITIQPSTTDPTTIHGLYYTSKDPDGSTLMLRSIPEIAQRIVDYHEETGGVTVMLLDEMTTASSASQNAMLGLLTHGQFGEVNISQITVFVMAANPEGTVSTVNPLSEAVINRGGHIPWYGDAELFLEEWSSGFGNDSRKPEELTEWYIRELIEGSMEKAFRSDNWDPDDLVPWDTIEHSERTTTDLAKIITYINNEFKSAPREIRHHYLIKATEALQGKEWAKRMSTVCLSETRVMTPANLKREVERSGINFDSEPGTVTALLEHKMFEVSTVRGGTDFITSEQVSELSSRLLKDFESTLNMESYLTLWAFATTCPNSGLAAVIYPELAVAMSRAVAGFNAGKVQPDQVKPKFATSATLDALKQLISN